MSQPLNYRAASPKRSPIPAIIDSLVVVAVLVAVNAAMVIFTARANEIDRGAYVILYTPANAATALASLACTPLARRWVPHLTTQQHVAISLLFPILAIIAWAIAFMAAAP